MLSLMHNTRVGAWKDASLSDFCLRLTFIFVIFGSSELYSDVTQRLNRVQLHSLHPIFFQSGKRISPSKICDMPSAVIHMYIDVHACVYTYISMCLMYVLVYM